MRRQDLLTLLAALAVGISAGLGYGWLLQPAPIADTTPDSLRQEFRSDYLALIAAAYGATHDLERARTRLDLFPSDDPADQLAAYAQERQALGRPGAAGLASLAAALKEAAPETLPAATVLPSPSAPLPGSTSLPPAAPEPRITLVSAEKACDTRSENPQLMIHVGDPLGIPLPGIMIMVLWDQGSDRFFTGLKPEVNAGYADFRMQPGAIYTIRVENQPDPLSGLAVEECLVGGQTFPSSWVLKYEIQP